MEKSPCIHDVMFCIKSFLYAKNVANDCIILPNINPTNGINTGSLNLMFSKIFIKINVPNNAKAKEMVIFNNGDDDVNNISEISTPKRAESNVPAVVGDTNLLLLNCCIISPAIL